jgi:hypothetical protein
MFWCDHSDKVVSWDFENLKIPYVNSMEKTRHTYLIDFMIDIIEPDKNSPKGYKVVRYVIEVKPIKQLLPPDRKRFKSKKSYMEAAVTYIINKDKREATLRVCRKKGWRYKAITERDLFGKKSL